MKAVLFMFVCIATVSSLKDGSPKIDDLFKSLTEDNVVHKRPPNVQIKNININLEKLNMTKFMENVKQLMETFQVNITDDNSLVLKEYNTRRLATYGTDQEWKNASMMLVKNKLFDLMLQTIYMARHKIKQVENEPYYNPEDTSYRIAFLYRKIRRIWKRMLDIYTTMQRNRDKKKGPFADVDPYLVLHHKAARLHVDFLYYWWVLIRLHEKYATRHGIPNTTPGESTTASNRGP